MPNKKIGIAYIPVLHQGYLEYLAQLEKEGISELYVVSDEILALHEELDYLNRKDRLRAVPHEVMKQMIALCSTLPITSLTKEQIRELSVSDITIVSPKEDINTFIVDTYFKDKTVIYHTVFLRWNRENLGEDTEPKGEHIALSTFEKEVFHRVMVEAEKSADWWRQVGAAIVRDDALIACAHNEHMPEKELPNIFGDTRALFKKGVNIDYVTTAHAEAAAIADAARRGVSTEGSALFTTDFPCPYCARVVAKSGIKKIYYVRGYAVLGGDAFFNEMGIEVVKVDGVEQI